jgi:lipid II:glycine glycyltransferase (peptidoglycan interpeptide bridge formation enzyme)
MMQPFTGGASEWNTIIRQLPKPHLLQTWEWAQFKAAYGWKPMPFIWRSGRVDHDEVVAAVMIHKRQVLNRSFAARLCILYAPKGPLFDWSNENLFKQVREDLQYFAKKQGAIFLKIDPDVLQGTGIPEHEEEQENKAGQIVISHLEQNGWLFSSDQIQFRNTVLVDLSKTEEELLSGMKQKSRYNVRLAEKKGVSVRVGTLEDLTLLYKMYAETSIRDGFVIRNEGYYRSLWRSFMNSTDIGHQPSAEPLIAEVNGEPIAAIIVFYFAGCAYFLHGMSFDIRRELMPNYLLQWEAIRRAKARGCSVYDLWGAPDKFNENDPMWGVFRFKEGLGGKVVRTLGAWDYPASLIWYKTYTQVIPQVLGIMRARGKEQTRKRLE